MATAIFDTHAFVKRLTAAGMPVEQAEILADEQVRLIGEHLATKADLKALEDRLADRLTIRFGAMLAAAIVLVGALVKLL
jgi:hypothetical protein